MYQKEMGRKNAPDRRFENGRSMVSLISCVAGKYSNAFLTKSNYLDLKRRNVIMVMKSETLIYVCLCIYIVKQKDVEIREFAQRLTIAPCQIDDSNNT